MLRGNVLILCRKSIKSVRAEVPSRPGLCRRSVLSHVKEGTCRESVLGEAAPSEESGDAAEKPCC